MHQVEHASTGPQRLPDWNPNAGGISAFYFRDPDRHFLEIISFPGDKGSPKWHQATKEVFLGIDHTAIVVDDSNASLRFYRDMLGMQVAGESDNYDVEQEHLNNVFGARLRITALRAARGPGIELLEEPCAARWPAGAGRSPRQRCCSLADDADRGATRAVAGPRARASNHSGVAGFSGRCAAGSRISCWSADARPGRPRDAVDRSVTRRRLFMPLTRLPR